MAQYLSKLLPQLSTVIEPLRNLECKNTQWYWLSAHNKAVTKIKQLICAAQILRYFDPIKQVTLQCDAPEHGLGYLLLQEGQPIVYSA